MSSSSPAYSKSTWQSRLPFFYGWVVVGSSFVSLALSHGVYYTFAVFFVALLEEFGWGRGPTAGVFSVFVLTTSLGGALAGVLRDRFGPSSSLTGKGAGIVEGRPGVGSYGEVSCSATPL